METFIVPIHNGASLRMTWADAERIAAERDAHADSHSPRNPECDCVEAQVADDILDGWSQRITETYPNAVKVG